MYPVSSAFGEAVRAGGKRSGWVEAWYGGARLSWGEDIVGAGGGGTVGFGTQTFGTSPFGVGGGAGVTVEPQYQLPLRADATNQVSVDGTSDGPRRVISLSLAPMPGLWDLLAPMGTELRAYTVLEYTHGATEVVPQGVFGIDVQRMGYGSTGDLQITAPDRWQQIANAEFLTPRAATAGLNVRLQIAQLINEVFPSLGAVDTATSTVTVPPQTWDRDRAKAIRDLAKSASLDVGFDRDGNPYIRDAPSLAAGAVWLVDASATGVMIDADRERNRQRTYNIVKVSSPANSEGGELFDPVFVWDNNSASPTFAGSGPGFGTTPPALSTAGPFGQRCYFYSSPLITDGVQATAAGVSLLEKVMGLGAQLTLTAAPNPALDDGDTIQVVLPPERYDIPRPVERHIVDKLTVPLTPKGAQSIDTRSTVADIDESGA